jgi:hypothetical protein
MAATAPRRAPASPAAGVGRATGEGLRKIYRGLVRVAAAAAGAQGQPGNATDGQQTGDPYRRLFVSGASLIRHNQAFGTG